jgi:pyruvate ferredoxin oxidoreductase gamma subunit
MLRIRFHGRGGQGMKTASRIIGTAAFWEGRYAQDSPVYGAERRGAPMVAFTRIAEEPILERGLIASPNIVVVADETLLDDAQARPLQGLTAAGCALINSHSPPEALRERYGLTSELAVLDGTELALTHVGSVAGLSVALGGATCNLAGLSPAAMEHAVQEELAALGLDSARIEQNLGMAHIAYEQLTVRPPLEEPAPAVSKAASLPQPTIVTPIYQGALRGAPSVLATANTPLRKTGNWRVWRPVIDLSHCSRCWICFVSCPDGAIALDEQDRLRGWECWAALFIPSSSTKRTWQRITPWQSMRKWRNISPTPSVGATAWLKSIVWTMPTTCW